MFIFIAGMHCSERIHPVSIRNNGDGMLSFFQMPQLYLVRGQSNPARLFSVNQDFKKRRAEFSAAIMYSPASSTVISVSYIILPA